MKLLIERYNDMRIFKTTLVITTEDLYIKTEKNEKSIRELRNIEEFL